MNKFLTYLPVITLAVSLIIGGTTLKIQAENTKAKVDELDKNFKDNEKSIAEVKEDNKDLDKKIEVSKIEQKNTEKKVEEVSQKTDKIISLLMELKAKK